MTWFDTYTEITSKNANILLKIYFKYTTINIKTAFISDINAVFLVYKKI